MIPSSNELLYFVEIANTMNLSRAAEKLAISQPALTLAMQRLENSIGTHLLIRDKKGVYLTQAGKKLLTNAKQLLHCWEMTKSQSLASHQEIQGSVSIGCHSTVASHLNQLLPDLLETHPKLSLKIKHEISANIIDEVINLKLDIGIVTIPIKHPDLIVRKLMRGGLGFFTGEGSRPIQQINSGESVLIYNPDLLQSQLLLKKTKLQFARTVPTNSLEIAANLVASGGGIGILPLCIDQFMYTEKLKPIQNLPTLAHDICMIYRNENRNVQAIRALTTAVINFFTPQ